MLDVAKDIFAAQGYRATSMDEIAERCGVSKPMLYEYFGSKDGLLLACVAKSRAELFEATKEAVAGATEPHEIIARGMLAYFEFMDAHKRSFSMLLQESMALPSATAEELEAVRREQGELISPILAGFAPAASARQLEAYTEIIIGACERLALWRLRNTEVTAAEAARHMTEFTLNGLGEQPA